jgi:hypothetical protein
MVILSDMMMLRWIGVAALPAWLAHGYPERLMCV